MSTRTMEARALITAHDRTGRTFQQVAGKMRALDHQARAVNRSMAMTNGVIAGAARALMPFIAPVAIGYGIKALAGESLSLERTMIQVQKATNATGADLKAYEQTILDLSRETGKSKEEIGGIMAAAAFAGRPVQDLARYTEFAAKATSAWGTGAEETGQALAELANTFKATQPRLEQIGDAINHVADNAAAGEKDLIEFLRRSGAVGDQAGFSAEQTIAFGAAMKEVGVNTQVASQTFNTLVNAMALGDGFLKGSAEGYKALGLNAAKVQKEFAKKPMETTVKLLERIAKITDPIKRADLLTNMFGKEYQDNVAILAGNLGGLQRALDLVADKETYAGSVGRNFQDSVNTDVGRIEKATAALEVLAVHSGNVFKVIAGSAAEEVNRLVDAMERGDGFFQRYQRFVDGQNEARDPDFKRKEAEDIAANEATKTAILDFLKSPFVWADSQLGATGDEAESRGRLAGINARLAEEEKVFKRIEELRAQREKMTAPDAVVPNHMLDANDRKLAAAEREAMTIRARRGAGTRFNLPSVGDGVTRPFTPSGFGLTMPGAAEGSQFANVPLPPPRPVDITGQVTLDPASKVDVNVKVTVEGEGRVTGMSAVSSGSAQGNVGTSMPHIKSGAR